MGRNERFSLIMVGTMANPNWNAYSAQQAELHMADGARAQFTPSFSGFQANDFRAYVRLPDAMNETPVTIERVDFFGVGIARQANVTLASVPLAGSQLRFTLEGLPIQRQTDLVANQYSGATVNENAERAAAQAAVVAVHFHGSAAAFSGDAHDQIARDLAQRAEDAILLITDEADRSRLKLASLPLLNTAENVRSVLVNEGGTWRVETTSELISGFGFKSLPDPTGAQQQGKFLGVADNRYQLLNPPANGGGGGGTGGADGDLVNAVPSQDTYGITFTRRSGAAFNIQPNPNFRAIGENLLTRNVGAQGVPPQATFPISGGNEETEGSGTASGRLARLTTTNRFAAQIGSADVRVAATVEWEAGTFAGFAPRAELDIRVATADGTGTSIGTLTLHNNEIQPFSFEVTKEAADAAVSDGNGFYNVNFVATGMTRGGAAPHGTLTFADITVHREGFGYEPAEGIARAAATDIIDPVREVVQGNSADIMANTNAISELQRRSFYTPRQDVIDFHALIGGEHIDGETTYEDPFRRLFRATPAGAGAIATSLDDDGIAYNANIGGRRGITGLGMQADKVIYCELSNPTEHALYIRIGSGSQAFYGIHTDANNNRWHTFYDPDETVGLDAGRKFAEDGSGNVAYLPGDRIGYSAEVRPGNSGLWIIPVIFRAAGGNPIQCNDIEFNSSNAVAHYDPDAILIHTGDFVEDLWVAYHSGASIRHSQIEKANFTKLDGLGLRNEGTGRDRIAITGEVDFTAGIYDNGVRIRAGYPITMLAAYDATALGNIAAVSADANTGVWIIPANMSVGGGIPDAAFTDETGGDAPTSSGGERLLLAGSVCRIVSGTDIRLVSTPRLAIENLSFSDTTRNLTATRQDGSTFTVNIPGGSGGGGGGLTPEQVGGLITAQVQNWARVGNAALIPQAKVENLSADLGLRITQTQGDNRYRLQSVALTAADIPNHSAAKLTSGVLRENVIPASIARDSELSELLKDVSIAGRRLTFQRQDEANDIIIDIPNPTADQIPALPQDKITGLTDALAGKQNTLPAGTDGQVLGRVGGALAFVDQTGGGGGTAPTADNLAAILGVARPGSQAKIAADWLPVASGGTGVTELTLSNQNRNVVFPANYAEQDFINLVFGSNELITDNSEGTAQLPTSYFGNSNFVREFPIGDNSLVTIGWTASTRTLTITGSNLRFYSATLFSVGGSGSGGGDTIDAASLAAVLSVAKPPAQDVIDASWIPVLAQAKISGLQDTLNNKQDKLPDGTEENTALVWNETLSQWQAGVFPAGGGGTPTQNDPEHIRAAWFGGGDPRSGEPFSVPVAKVFAGGAASDTPALAEVASGAAFPAEVTFTNNIFSVKPTGANRSAGLRVQWESDQIDFTAIKMKADFGRPTAVNHQDIHFYFGSNIDPSSRFSAGLTGATSGLIVFVYGANGRVEVRRMDTAALIVNAAGVAAVGEDDEWECVFFKGRIIVRQNGVSVVDEYLTAANTPPLTGAKFGFLGIANARSSGSTNSQVDFSGVSVEDVTSEDIDPHSHAGGGGGTAPESWAAAGNTDLIPATKLPIATVNQGDAGSATDVIMTPATTASAIEALLATAKPSGERAIDSTWLTNAPSGGGGSNISVTSGSNRPSNPPDGSIHFDAPNNLPRVYVRSSGGWVTAIDAATTVRYGIARQATQAEAIGGSNVSAFMSPPLTFQAIPAKLSAAKPSGDAAIHSTWLTNAPAGIGDLSDVDTASTAPANDDVLTYDGTNWIPKAPSSGGESPTAANLATVLGVAKPSGVDAIDSSWLTNAAASGVAATLGAPKPENTDPIDESWLENVEGTLLKWKTLIDSTVLRNRIFGNGSIELQEVTGDYDINNFIGKIEIVSRSGITSSAQETWTADFSTIPIATGWRSGDAVAFRTFSGGATWYIWRTIAGRLFVYIGTGISDTSIESMRVQIGTNVRTVGALMAMPKPDGVAAIDSSWLANAPGLPSGGTAGQILQKDSAADGDASWIDAPSGGGKPSDVRLYTQPATAGDRVASTAVTVQAGDLELIVLCNQGTGGAETGAANNTDMTWTTTIPLVAVKTTVGFFGGIGRGANNFVVRAVRSASDNNSITLTLRDLNTDSSAGGNTIEGVWVRR